MCHHTAGADHGIFANRYAPHDVNTCANPHVVPDDNGPGITVASLSALWIERMVRRVESHVRPNQHMVANHDFVAVEHHTVEVGKEIITDRDVPSEFAAEGRFKMYVPSHFLEHPLQEPLPFFPRLFETLIIGIGEQYGFMASLHEFGRQIIIFFAREHLLA